MLIQKRNRQTYLQESPFWTVNRQDTAGGDRKKSSSDKPISILRNGKNRTRTIKIRAPSDLEAGHVFTVNVEGEEITAAVVSIC